MKCELCNLHIEVTDVVMFWEPNSLVHALCKRATEAGNGVQLELMNKKLELNPDVTN